MSEQEKKNCPEYQAGKAAAKWWQSLSEEQRKQMDIVDAFAYGVLYGWNNPNWISVEEQLPENDGGFSDEVYVHCAKRTSHRDEIAIYNFISNCWMSEFSDDEITHWMEIQPPQGKEDKGFVAMQSGKPA